MDFIDYDIIEVCVKYDVDYLFRFVEGGISRNYFAVKDGQVYVIDVQREGRKRSSSHLNLTLDFPTYEEYFKECGWAGDLYNMYSNRDE